MCLLLCNLLAFVFCTIDACLGLGMVGGICHSSEEVAGCTAGNGSFFLDYQLVKNMSMVKVSLKAMVGLGCVGTGWDGAWFWDMANLIADFIVV